MNMFQLDLSGYLGKISFPGPRKLAFRLGIYVHGLSLRTILSTYASQGIRRLRKGNQGQSLSFTNRLPHEHRVSGSERGAWTVYCGSWLEHAEKFAFPQPLFYLPTRF